jgi:hypothetical protein
MMPVCSPAPASPLTRIGTERFSSAHDALTAPTQGYDLGKWSVSDCWALSDVSSRMLAGTFGEGMEQRRGQQ